MVKARYGGKRPTRRTYAQETTIKEEINKKPISSNDKFWFITGVAVGMFINTICIIIILYLSFLIT